MGTRRKAGVLGVIRAVGLQHVLEMLGLGDQEHALRLHPKRYAAVVMARHLQQQSEWIARIMQRGELRADSGPSRTVIPTHRGQRSGDRGQLPMSV
jgi:hypothetical protein